MEHAAAVDRRLRWGPAGTLPVLWADAATAATSHTVTLAGLLPTTAYEIEIDATAQDGETAHASLSITTPAASGQVAATTRDGVLLVNGAPFFPLIAWQQCPDQWEPNLAQGIDLFAGNPCTGLASLLTALQGRALAVGTSDDAAAAGPGPDRMVLPRRGRRARPQRGHASRAARGRGALSDPHAATSTPAPRRSRPGAASTRG